MIGSIARCGPGGPGQRAQAKDPPKGKVTSRLLSDIIAGDCRELRNRGVSTGAYSPASTAVGAKNGKRPGRSIEGAAVL